MPNVLRSPVTSADNIAKILQNLQGHGMTLDAGQERLVNRLGTVGAEVPNCQTRGIYVYGPPGRGKTMIVNAFVAALPSQTCARYHFHEFFRELNSPKNYVPGQPMGSIFSQGLERELSGLQVLVFDEFHCTEPGDAMLMAKLVKYCATNNIFLLTTSNYEPERLLDDDTFHHLVRPTIQSIRESFEIIELDQHIDYRMQQDPNQVFLSGYRAGTLNVRGEANPPMIDEQMIEIGYDRIGPARSEQDSIWIGFDQLCRTRRNTADYLELATRYSTWHIIGIPNSAQLAMDEERRLANVIDVFYDKNIELNLYTEDRLEHLGHMLHDTERARLTSRLAQLTHITFDRTESQP